MDTAVVAKKLNAALTQQYRTALAYSVAAGSLRGVSYTALAETFSGWALDDLRGAQLLIEKVVAVGGEPVVEPGPLRYEAAPQDTVELLIEAETESVAALHAAIEDTGQEPHSEALEHLLEHEIMRKQRHLDTLRRMTAEG